MAITYIMTIVDVQSSSKKYFLLLSNFINVRHADGSPSRMWLALPIIQSMYNTRIIIKSLPNSENR